MTGILCSSVSSLDASNICDKSSLRLLLEVFTVDNCI